MLKSVAFAGLLAASCAASAATTWSFEYTGFYDEIGSVFDASRKISGSFTGTDSNNNGIVEQGEISSLLVNGTNYISCAAGSNDYYQCGTYSFNYDVAAKTLDFFAGTSGTDPDGYSMAGHYFQTGQREEDYQYVAGFYHATTSYAWTDQTEFAISGAVLSGGAVSAVPEPGTWTMLAAGLLLISGAALRRKDDAVKAQ